MNKRTTHCTYRLAAWLVGAFLTAGCSSDPVVSAAPDAGSAAPDAGAVDVVDAGPSCSPSQLVCNGVCVNAQTDNAHCGACGRACAAGQVCSLGACATTCAPSLTACAGSGDSGVGASCVDLANDRLHCGACGAACPAGNICVNRSCQVSCPAGQAQCGGACVDLRTSNAHCGACGTACAPGTACAAGVCAVSCGAGLTQCSTACVNLQTDNAHCGACGAVCPAGSACSRGACSATCASPLVECTAGGRSFCANTSIDPAHCGACGNACSLPGAVSGCAAGGCTVARCEAGLGDCDGAAGNGCETSLGTSSAHCGACGRTCSLPNATSACAGGACGVTACAAGFLDCDMSAANGCEVRSLSDNANCGVCGRACAAGRVCAAGACVATCAAPLSLCGGGCVNTSNDPSNCGSCGASCSAGANATAVCAAGSCAFVCSAGFADCDRNPANGCEVNLTSSVTHCGACGLSCPVRPGAASVCAAGSCGFLCASGTADCDGNPGNGCEASTNSVSNCGACGVACPARPGATAACTAGACRSSCIAGYADCDGNPTNGCEVDTRTSSTNCGGCGTACPSGRVCAGGTCLSATSCRSIREQNSSAPSGVYLIDPDGAGSGAAFNVYCEMSTAGGGWTVMAYLRSNAQWDTPVFSNTGIVGNTSGGFAQGATLSASAATFTERIIIYRRLIELGTDLGTQWMITYRQNGVATPYSGFNVASGWGYRDSFGYADPTVNSACSHGCSSFRGLGMFHDSESGFGYAGTQGGNYGCVDGNNICWVPRSLSCNVGSQRCSLLSGTNEGVIYAGR